jgi:tritrans,polycis-undecaprenyl-diphosphate synthase [geranylgeranyl-diphosphate specific]
LNKNGSNGILSKISDFLMKPFYWAYKKKLWGQIKNREMPEHIGIILDGNRRFAKERDLPPWYGHEAGAEAVERILKYCFKLGIKILTLYAFSTENFNRPEKEVQKIMEIAKRKFREIKEQPMIHKYKVKIKAIGRLYQLPEDLQKIIQEAEERTANYEDFQINIAISYGGRNELVDSMKKIAQRVKDNELKIEDIDEDTISSHLYTKGIPDPDVIIRTSGEERLSGFLLWQGAYSELIFLELYWPAIRKIDLWRAIRVFQQRSRRFGE